MAHKISYCSQQSCIITPCGHREVYFVCKRALDLVLSVLALLVLWPLLILISLAIKIDSPGPIIFAQERIGSKRKKNGQNEEWVMSPFTIYKFRTMQHNCDQSVHEDFMKVFIEGREDLPVNRDMPTFKMVEDPRVTRLGKFLRQTSLDELPQLINVLKGEMSLVGPRPPIRYEVERYSPAQRRRLAGTPGLTGLWQVEGRSQVSFEESVRMDIEYLERQSFLLDIKILLKTVGAVLQGRGAH